MSTSNNTNNNNGSLRPTWSRASGSGTGGGGFQPPPAVPERQQSTGTTNKFSALDEDDNANSSNNKPRPAYRARSYGEKRGGGRSLADLAATVPEGQSGGGVGGAAAPSSSSSSSRTRWQRSGSFAEEPDQSTVKKVIRFTREKLLALRPRPDGGDEGDLPEALKILEGAAIISKEILDPG